MGKLSAKHSNETPLRLTDFTGGLNVSINREAIAMNELSRADNVEFSRETGALGTVCGFRPVFNAELPIKTLFYDHIHDVYLFSTPTGGTVSLYKTNLTTKTLIGVLTGTSTPMYTAFAGKLLIASGGKLQSYDGITLTTIATSPTSDIVITRHGRVVVAKTGSDRITYSSIGDATSADAWTNVSDDQSSSQWLDIGAQDSCKIVAIVPVSQDLLIFKRGDVSPFGYVFRIVGEFPDWVIYEVSRNIHCSNSYSAVQVVNDVYFVGTEGFNAISTVMEYGSVKQNMTGKKVNPAITNAIVHDEARTWHVPTKQQIWVKGQNDNSIYMYHYTNGAFTMRRFATGYVSDVAYKNDDIYIAIGNKILFLDSKIYTEDGMPIKSIINTKTFVADNQTLIKHVDVDIFNLAIGEGTIKIGYLAYPIGFGNAGVAIYGDIEDIFGDTVDIYENPTTEQWFSCNYATKSFDIQVQMVSGGLSIRAITLRIVEV